MKTFALLVFLCLGANTLLYGQESEASYYKHVQTLDGTLAALYGVISGEKGEARDWELFRYLFKPDARLIPSGRNIEGVLGLRYMSPDDYIASSGTWLAENGFFETEIHRDVQTFGSLIQVFSTYESFHSKQDTIPFMRGINSIQLLDDGERFWIVNIYWRQESEENPIPAMFLPKQ